MIVSPCKIMKYKMIGGQYNLPGCGVAGSGAEANSLHYLLHIGHTPHDDRSIQPAIKNQGDLHTM
jgi:hypothetical protein